MQLMLYCVVVCVLPATLLFKPHENKVLVHSVSCQIQGTSNSAWYMGGY